MRLSDARAYSIPGQWREVPPGWTPDGVMLLLSDDGLHRVQPSDNAAGETVEAELWLETGPNPGWATAGRRSPPPQTDDGILWLVHREGVDRVDLGDGTVTQHFEGRLGNKRAANAESIFSQHARRVDRLDLGTGERTTLFTPKDLPPHEAGPREKLEWELPDGSEAAGYLFLPPGHDGEPVPVIVEVYPGLSLRTSGFFMEQALLTSAGYGVFLPQIPIKESTNLMEEIQIGVDAAVDALLESGLADPERLAIQGQSFGLFAVFSVLVGEGGSRFRAAAASNGTFDLLPAHQLGAHWWVESGQGGMRATPWEEPERYQKNSPYWRLDRVSCPVLLIQGEADASGPKMQMAYYSLLRLDKPVELRVYEGGGHGPMGWPASQQRDLVARLLEWYAEHLGAGAGAGEIMKDEG